MKEISIWMNVGLSMIGYLFIMWKSAGWATGLILPRLMKRKKDSRQQKAVNELYDAFNLDQVKDGSTMRVTTKGNLTIVMFRTEKKP